MVPGSNPGGPILKVGEKPTYEPTTTNRRRRDEHCGTGWPRDPGPVDQAELVTSLVDYERLFGGPGAGHELWLGVKQFFDNGGRRAWAVRLGGQGPAAIRRALSALDGVDDLGLLCLPGLSAPGALAAAAAYARARRAFYVAEAAGSRSATLNAVGAIAAADQGHVAVYLPRLVIRDPLRPPATMRFGPSAAVAGLLARTDIERGVWAFATGRISRAPSGWARRSTPTAQRCYGAPV